MRTRLIFYTAGSAILAIFLLFLWHHAPLKTSRGQPHTDNHAIENIKQQKSQPIPAQNHDPSEWEHRLAARGGASDLESISQTFKDSGNCLRYFVALHEVRAIQGDDRLNDLSKETLKTVDSMDESLKQSLSVLEKTKALCAGANQELVARTFMTSVLDAAIKGDADAQSCFVVTGAVIPSPEAMLSGKYTRYLETRYLQHANKFTKLALERADPYVAKKIVLQFTTSPSSQPSLQDNPTRLDPALILRAARLASLRALPEQRQSLEDSLSEFERLKLIPDNEIRRANDWAETIYAREFYDKPKLDLNSFGSCSSLQETSP